MLTKLLSDKREAILKSWFQLIVETYPAESSRFLSIEKDRFANPVGFSLRDGIGVLFDDLLAERQTDQESSELDGIIRVRAIQQFRASEAVTFVFLLKYAIRSELDMNNADAELLREMLAFESRVDRLALTAFDIHIACREQLMEVRINELKRCVPKTMELEVARMAEKIACQATKMDKDTERH